MFCYVKTCYEFTFLNLYFKGAGLLVYAGVYAFSGSEAQAAENDQKSAYNTQKMGLDNGAIEDEVEEEEKEDYFYQKKLNGIFELFIVQIKFITSKYVW